MISTHKKTVLICVAADVEFNAVKRFLADNSVITWSRIEPEIRGKFSETSEFTNQNGDQLRLVVAKPHEQGLVPCATVTSASIQIFRPNLVSMVGIAAGRPEKTEIGDILVSSDIWDYNAGKWSEEKKKLVFQPDKKGVKNPDSIIANLTDRIQDDSEYWQDIHKFWKNLKDVSDISGPPTVRFVPTTSGAAVVDAISFWDKITTQERKAIGLDMEGYAVAYATEAMRMPRYKPDWVVAKSVCDQGFNKHKKFQEYAAFTSTMFLRRLLKTTNIY